MLKAKLLAGGGAEATYVDDVFSAYTYTGNGSTQTITNGIDLSGQGGLVWFKPRSTTTGHYLFDTLRGNNKTIRTESTGAETTTLAPITFSSTGFDLSNAAGWNASTTTYASWTFRKAAKFFDVVTWTGNATNRTISHSLGQEVGLIFVKRTDSAADWQVYHRSLANTEYAVLNTTAAKATGATRWNSTTPTTSVFSLGTDVSVNASGGTYVAYLFAHDTGTDGIVQCGSFSAGSGVTTTINLGWEPQYILVKASSSAGDWRILDTIRGIPTGAVGAADDSVLRANTTDSEATLGIANVTSTGFEVNYGGGNITYIYLAIRRPNKPPTVGTQVYNAIARTGTGAAATVTGVGFAPDLVMPFNRSGVAGVGHPVYDRLRGALKSLRANLTDIENSDTASLTAFGMDGMTLGADGAEFINSSRESSIINHFFKRAPGVFDVVCYAGQSSVQAVTHGLAATPELIFVKNKTSAQSWAVYSASIPVTKLLRLNTTNAAITDSKWNDVAPTSTVFYLTNVADVNSITNNYVAYLFATKAGISKVFNYTGNGSSQTINCGFTTGARFVLIKRTDIAGDWYVWDTVRGIIAGNDPHLSLNTTAAEVTTNDSVDPDASGFIVNQVTATNINVTSAIYIGLAFA